MAAYWMQCQDEPREGGTQIQDWTDISAHNQMLYPLGGFQANEYNDLHLTNQKVLNSSY